MTDKPFLEKYSNQSVDDLVELSSQYRTDSIVQAFETALLIKSNQNLLYPFSNTEKVIVLVEDFEREINNGGFSQYFANSVHNTPFVIEALKKINCLQSASLVEKAIKLLNIGSIFEEAASVSIEDEKFNNLLELIEEAADDDDVQDEFDKLDEHIYSNYEDIAEKLFQYIKKNKSDISFK